jgi:parallel beta-helix repeat protein
VLACALALAGIAAAAPNPSPYDGGPAGLPLPSVPALPTLPFPLGTDLSDVGVNAADLASDGPTMNMAASNYGSSRGDDEDDGDHDGSSGGGSSSHPQLLVVDDDRTECPSAQFTRIQDAVNAASPGAFIKVCRGTYVEDVQVPAGKDNLTVYGTGFLEVTIKAPPAPTVASLDYVEVVHVTGAKNFKLINVVVTGPFTGLAGCSQRYAGVRVDAGGSAGLFGDVVTQIRDATETLNGCQQGIGILVGRASTGQVGSAEIAYTLVNRYAKGGIVVDNAGSYGYIHHSIVQGDGPTLTSAQNGIQISRGATGTVAYDRVSDNEYNNPAVASSSGILLYQAGKVQLRSNDAFQNNIGVWLSESSNSLVDSNYTHNQTSPGGLYADGIYVDSLSTNNTVSRNVSRYNDEYDCADDSAGTKTAGTANSWIKDIGDTENRPGLCHAH